MSVQNEQMHVDTTEYQTSIEIIGEGYAEQVERAFPDLVKEIDTAYEMLDDSTKELLMAKPAGRKWGGSENSRQGW